MDLTGKESKWKQISKIMIHKYLSDKNRKKKIKKISEFVYANYNKK